MGGAMKAAHLNPAVVCVVSLLCLAGCEQKIPEPAPEPRPAVSAVPERPEPPELIKEDVTVGTGAEAKTGDKVTVHYTGRLLKTNFTFDSSIGKSPHPFTIGKGEVIKGWEEGIAGMKAGGKRKLTIPSKLGYGDAGNPPKIPGKATLVFDVELVSIGDDPDAGAKDAGGEKVKGH
jgi:hypothetical protein